MNINREAFFKGYREEFGRLSQAQVDALNNLLDSIEGDDEITDLRDVAYILATIKHETANTFEPIEEYGKGRGRKYGVTDPETGQKYYGRGYVQLTWRKNYQIFADLLDVDLVANPELALDPETAWKITSIGMRKGLFTGKKLATYINNLRCDYVGARRIINGTDKASLIAGYAQAFESLLSASGSPDAIQHSGAGVVPDSPPTHSVEALDAGGGQPIPEAPIAQPAQTNEAGSAGVIIQPNALTQPTAPIVSSPTDPPIPVTQGGFKAMVTSAIGWITGAGAGVIALLKDNQTLLIIAAVVVVIAGLAYFIRQLILDRERMRIASDPAKYNVR